MTIAYADNAFTPESVALEYELEHLYGVSVMPKGWAEDHKAAMLRGSRGDASWLHHQAAMTYARIRDHMMESVFIVGLSFFALSLFLVFLFGPDTIEARIGIPVLSQFSSAFVTVLAIFIIDSFVIGRRWATLGNYWQRTGLMENDFREMPRRLQRRIDMASRRDGTRIRVERFGQDPLLIVETGPFWNRSKVYIGGWETGDPKIDNF